MQGLSGMLLPILILVFFYFFLILPEQKKQKKAKQLVESLTVGSSIMTRGGIYGKIVDINEDVIVIATGPDNVKISLSRYSVSTVTNSEEIVKNEEINNENEVAAESNENKEKDE